MRKIKILQVDLLNFKGFSELHVSFEGKDAVVLGGLNGYGKTTLFDALELLFTGSIKRMEGYSEYHDNRNAMGQDSLPLVYSKNFSKEVSIQAILQVDQYTLCVSRKADVNDMRNPVDFCAFSGLMIHTLEGEDKVMTDEELHEYGFDDLKRSYSFLNYLSQEEATAFLKRKEVDRANDISELFNLSPFDTPLGKIKNVTASLKNKKEDARKQKENALEKVESLKNTAGQNKAEVPYYQICTESQYWDVENPKLSHEQFHALLAENGLMDKLKLYVEHQKEYKQYRINKYVDSLLQDNNKLKAIAFEIKYGHLNEVIELWKLFRKNVLSPCLNLSFGNLDQLFLHIPEQLMPFIEASDIDEFESMRDNLLQTYRSLTTFQQQMSKLLENREALAVDVKENIDNLPSVACPLCGSHFEDKRKLSESISEYGDVLNKYFTDSGVNQQKQLNILRGYMQDHFVKPINNFFLHQGVTQNLSEQYSQLDLQFARKSIPALNKLDIQIDKELTLDSIVSALNIRLFEKKAKLPENLDFEELDKAFQLGGRYISKEFGNVEAITNKKFYLQMVWSQMASQELQKWQKDFDKYAKREKAIVKLQKDLGKLRTGLEKQRQAYFSGLLSDIKILFYIYSGRIMQTCYFGRGLFIKPDDKCKHIIFTSDSNQANDVDALFNMSSGQLVTLVISLLLSLNKLYGKTSILAIDDPIQTIDDINLWGLIETLRHDFDDHFLLLSTHERDYRDLLAYKLDKWGINTKIVDMSEVESIR